MTGALPYSSPVLIRSLKSVREGQRLYLVLSWTAGWINCDFQLHRTPTIEFPKEPMMWKGQWVSWRDGQWYDPGLTANSCILVDNTNMITDSEFVPKHLNYPSMEHSDSKPSRTYNVDTDAAESRAIPAILSASSRRSRRKRRAHNILCKAVYGLHITQVGAKGQVRGCKQTVRFNWAKAECASATYKRHIGRIWGYVCASTLVNREVRPLQTDSLERAARLGWKQARRL